MESVFEFELLVQIPGMSYYIYFTIIFMSTHHSEPYHIKLASYTPLLSYDIRYPTTSRMYNLHVSHLLLLALIHFSQLQ